VFTVECFLGGCLAFMCVRFSFEIFFTAAEDGKNGDAEEQNA